MYRLNKSSKSQVEFTVEESLKNLVGEILWRVRNETEVVDERQYSKKTM